MSNNECILAVVDPTAEQQPGLEKAARLASSLSAPLEMFVAQYDQYVDADDKARQSLMEHTREAMNKLAGDLPIERGTVTIDVRWTRPIDDAVLKKLEDGKPRIVVKDTHYHSMLKRTIFSNTDWNLIRCCPVPLLLAKEQALSASPHVVAAVDPVCKHDKPASLDRRILALGKTLAKALGGKLSAVHVFHDVTQATTVMPAVGGAMAVVPFVSAEELAANEKAHRAALDELISTASLDPSQGLLRRGDTVTELLDCADDLDADLMITGAISRSALDRMLIGQTAERILDKLPCDLLVVKPQQD